MSGRIIVTSDESFPKAADQLAPDVRANLAGMLKSHLGNVIDAVVDVVAGEVL